MERRNRMLRLSSSLGSTIQPTASHVMLSLVLCLSITAIANCPYAQALSAEKDCSSATSEFFCSTYPFNANCAWNSDHNFCHFNCTMYNGNMSACRNNTVCRLRSDSGPAICDFPSRCYTDKALNNQTMCQSYAECQFEVQDLDWDAPEGNCIANCVMQSLSECSLLPAESLCYVYSGVSCKRTSASSPHMPCHRRYNGLFCTSSRQCRWLGTGSTGICAVNCSALGSYDECSLAPLMCEWDDSNRKCRYQQDDALCPLLYSSLGSCPSLCDYNDALSGYEKCSGVACSAFGSPYCPSGFCTAEKCTPPTTSAINNTTLPTSTTSAPTTSTFGPISSAPTTSTYYDTASTSFTITTTKPTSTTSFTTTTTATTTSAAQASCSSFSSSQCPRSRCRVVSGFDGCYETCPARVPITCKGSVLCAATQMDCLPCALPQVQCWDSSCVSSYSLCPCRTSSQFKCSGDGKCVDSSYQCASSTSICGKNEIRCADDGSCQAKAADCPCPYAAPLRCSGWNWNGSRQCSSKLSDCESSCPIGFYRCWDGSCATTKDWCPCALSTPIRCPQNTSSLAPVCASTILDCACPAGTVRCGEVSFGCVPSCAVQLCNVTCPDGTCPNSDTNKCDCTAGQAAAAVIELSINGTNPLPNVNVAYDLRLLGAVTYIECGMDMSPQVNVSWALYNQTGHKQSIGLRLDSKDFFLPAYTLAGKGNQWYRIVLTALYVGTIKKTVTTSISFWSVAPSAAVSIVGGSCIWTSTSQPVDIRAMVSVPCTSAGGCTSSSSGGGLVPYTCNSLYYNKSKCTDTLRWTCTSTQNSAADCSKLLSVASTSYLNVYMPLGAYNVTVYLGSANATQLIIVSTPPALPSLSVRCTGAYITESLECYVVTDRKWRLSWTTFPEVVTTVGRFEFSTPITSTLRRVRVTAQTDGADGQLTTLPAVYNYAEYDITPLYASINCTHNGKSEPAIGLSTVITVRCAVDAEYAANTQVAFYYTVKGVEKVLSPFPSIVPVYTFTLPPLVGILQVVAKLYVDGRLIATTAAVGSTINVTYPLSSFAADAASLSATANRALSANDVTTTITAIGAMVAASVTMEASSSGTSITMLSQLAAVGVTAATALAKAYNLSLAIGATPLSASQTVSSATSLSNVLLQKSTSQMSTTERNAAAALLQKLSPSAAQHGGADVQSLMLNAIVSAAASTFMAESVAASVAIMMLLTAPIDGTPASLTSSVDSDAKVCGSKFVSTDAGSRNLSIGKCSVWLSSNFTMFSDSDSTKAGGLTGVLLPTGYPRVYGNASLASSVVQFNMVYDGEPFEVRGRDSDAIAISIYVGGDLASGAMLKQGHRISFWNETTKAWSNEGVTTTGPCKSDGSTVYDSVCGTTTHFTSFAVFAGDSATQSQSNDDEDENVLPYFVGGIVGAVFIIAVATIVAIKIHSSRKRDAEEEMDYNAANFDMGESVSAADYEMRLMR